MEGFGLILSFISGAALMFIVSEHYYKRIEAILKLKDKLRQEDRKGAIPLIDNRQAEAFNAGQPIRTRIERRP